eukprot:COSAG06_NODE_1790_length_8394_cov_34.639301_11_plen_64_part_00
MILPQKTITRLSGFIDFHSWALAKAPEKYTLGHSNGAMMAYVLPPCLLAALRCCCRVGLNTGS